MGCVEFILLLYAYTIIKYCHNQECLLFALLLPQFLLLVSSCGEQVVQTAVLLDYDIEVVNIWSSRKEILYTWGICYKNELLIERLKYYILLLHKVIFINYRK